METAAGAMDDATGRVVVPAEVEARDERALRADGIDDVSVGEAVLHRNDELVASKERRHGSERGRGVQCLDGAEDRTEWRTELRGSDRRGRADRELGQPLESQPPLADGGEMLVCRLDEGDLMAGTDQMPAGDAADGTRADDRETHAGPHGRAERRSPADGRLSAKRGGTYGRRKQDTRTAVSRRPEPAAVPAALGGARNLVRRGALVPRGMRAVDLAADRCLERKAGGRGRSGEALLLRVRRRESGCGAA